jgi:hypothetical protein
MDVVVLASDSHTVDGCDRVVLFGDQVLVQGKPADIREAHRCACQPGSRSAGSPSRSSSKPPANWSGG